MRFEVLKEGTEHQILTHRGKIYFILIRLRQVLKQKLHLNQGCVQSYFTRIEFHPKGTSTLQTEVQATAQADNLQIRRLPQFSSPMIIIPLRYVTLRYL